jgi:hypothetical protein
LQIRDARPASATLCAYCWPHLGKTISTLRVRGSMIATNSSTTT